MKLRNKRTGEIGNLVFNINPNRESYSVLSTENGDTVCGNLVIADYDSLAELNAEWEDYKEPKVAYWIDSQGDICVFSDTEVDDWTKEKQIGNYFDTEEEAKKAVEKLKALAEAKEDGLKIKGYYYNHEDLVISADIGKCNKLTLDTLFGKEID